MKRVLPALMVSLLLLCGCKAGKEGRTRSRDGGQALLIVDMQENLTGPDRIICVSREKIAAIIHPVNRLLFQCRARGTMIICLITRPETKGLFKNLFPARVPGLRPDPRLLLPESRVLIKHGPDGFSNPDLERCLARGRIRHLYLSGIVAEGCIYSTCASALKKGYRVTLVRDAIAGITEEGTEGVLKALRRAGAEVQNSNDLRF